MALGLCAALACAAPAAATPYIHAHRGGPLVRGVATYGENTMPAFHASAGQGYVLELDVKLTSDDVPVVIHDATLERTTPCTGQVAARTAASLRASCPSDIVGTDGNSVQLGAGDSRRASVPTLAEALAFARDAGARVNLEIKNLPVDPDFDASPDYANAVMDVVIASRMPPSRLIVQSFYPPNLDVAKSRLPSAETSLLTLAPSNQGGPAFARANGYDWVSPAFPVDQTFVTNAHNNGRRVVPYTLDTDLAIKQAAAAGVEELITNDPTTARRALSEVDSAPPAIPAPPSTRTCEKAQAARTLKVIPSYDPRAGAPRVFAMQFKQELRHVESYRTFRTKIECMIRDYVRPRLASGRPNVVAFNEDVGLMTIATGSRGAEARSIFGDPDRAPSCEEQGVPCGTVGALGAVTAGYSKEVALYRSRFPSMQPVSGAFVAATDTFARGWMQTFSDMARRYHVYILGSNNQAPFRESTDPTEIAQLRDPDEPAPRSVFVATKPPVYNEVFMWAPDRLLREGPQLLRNLVATNRKVPLTPIEEQIQLTNGPSTGPDAVENVRPYRVPGTEARISFATSLPAFVYGNPPPGTDPCSDTSRYYMRCLDKLGANLVMQDEANPGRWGATNPGGWQPLEWMTSTWRAVDDPTVRFSYNVTPHMVGNLADLAFDGQTAITQRGLTGRACHYVGNRAFLPEDPDVLRHYAGPKDEFVALAPWVAPDAPRAILRRVAKQLAPGSGDRFENDYLETAVVADLSFPARARAKSCITRPAGDATRPVPFGSASNKRKLRVRVRPRRARAGRRTRFSFYVRAYSKGKLRPLKGVTIRFAGRKKRTNRKGRASTTVRLGRRSSYRVKASRKGYRSGAARVRVKR